MALNDDELVTTLRAAMKVACETSLTARGFRTEQATLVHIHECAGALEVVKTLIAKRLDEYRAFVEERHNVMDAVESWIGWACTIDGEPCAVSVRTKYHGATWLSECIIACKIATFRKAIYVEISRVAKPTNDYQFDDIVADTPLRLLCETLLRSVFGTADMPKNAYEIVECARTHAPVLFKTADSVAILRGCMTEYKKDIDECLYEDADTLGQNILQAFL